MANHPTITASRFARVRHSALSVVALAALLLTASAHALTVVPRSFDELVQLADTVMVGTVQAVHSAFADDGLDENIVSSVRLGDLEVIKGNVAAESYTLQVPGGVVGRFAQDYPGIPVFHPGLRYVVFIRGNQRDFFPVVGVTQGLFRVLTDSRGRQVVVRDDIAAQAGRNHALRAITDSALGLDDFLQQIRDRIPTTGASAP